MIYYIRDEEGSLIGLKYNNSIYYYIKNLQEDIIGITDSNYNEGCRYEYDSFGKVITIKDNNGNIIEDESHIGIINPYRYRSYYYDKDYYVYKLQDCTKPSLYDEGCKVEYIGRTGNIESAMIRHSRNDYREYLEFETIEGPKWIIICLGLENNTI